MYGSQLVAVGLVITFFLKTWLLLFGPSLRFKLLSRHTSRIPWWIFFEIAIFLRPHSTHTLSRTPQILVPRLCERGWGWVLGLGYGYGCIIDYCFDFVLFYTCHLSNLCVFLGLAALRLYPIWRRPGDDHLRRILLFYGFFQVGYMAGPLTIYRAGRHPV